MSRDDALLSIDFWDTLVVARTGGRQRKRVRDEALREVASSYRDPLPDAEIEEAGRRASDAFHAVWFEEQRTPGTRELLGRMLAELGIAATDPEVEYLTGVFEESLWEGPPELVEGAAEAVRELAGRYKLAIISDTMFSPGRVIREYLARLELLDRFDSFLFSDEAGYSKPQVRAFEAMLEDTGCRADASWHIGDRLNTDVKGANEAGMRSILFTAVSEKGAERADGVTPDRRCESWAEVRELLL